jgi:DNA-binding response OmpR family regulator
MCWHILLVEDNPEDQRTLIGKLRLEGFEVKSVYDGRSALDFVGQEGLPHLAVVDISPPDVDGLELARILSQKGAPVIVTAADGSPETAIKSLRWADDFMRKPVAPEELAARITRVLSRVIDYSYARSPVIRIDERMQFDHTNNRLVVEEEPVQLTPIESRLLHTLVRHKGQVVDCRTLLARVWTSDDIYEDTLRVHIHRLRRKLEADPRHPKHILTQRGIGYSFHA